MHPQCGMNTGSSSENHNRVATRYLCTPKKGVHPQCGMNTGSSSEITTELLQGTYVLKKKEEGASSVWDEHRF